MKKPIFIISFILLLSVLLGFTAQDTRAVTLSDLQLQINRLYNQIKEIQKLLAQDQPTEYPEEQIQKTETPGDFAPGRILVRFKDNVPESRQADILRAHGLTKKGEIKQLKTKIISVPEKAEERIAQALSRNPNVEWAEPDYVVETLLIPNDPYYSVQWGLDMVQAPEAWDITTGSSEVIIAILDTGIDTTHPDLKDKMVASANFTSSDTSEDIHGHGTHVAGIAAASTNNAIGVAGLGFDSSLMNVKVLGDGGSGYWSWVASGITWAADNGAHVINMSLGGTSYSDLVEDAVNYAWDKGVVVIAGAGNRGTTTRFYPAAYDNCISVAATDRDDVRTSWSTYGNWVDVAAPGALIYSTTNDGFYGRKSGTSMASPHVAGLAGLLASIMTDTNNNGFINDEIRFIIENTTDNEGAYGIINGRINAFSAITLATDDSSKTLTGTITGTGSGTVNVNPPDINYTDDFTRDYEYGTAVNLTATPDYDGGSLFFGWSGGCTGREDCSLYMFLDKSVTATFNIGHTLNVSSVDGGSVLLPGEGEFVYRKDQTVTLRAIADLGYQFVNWTGDTGTIGNPDYNRTTVIMKDDYSITANFEPAPECVTYNGYTYCRGFRSTDPQGSSCEAACSERGYICAAGDNMLRSLSEITEVGFKLGLLAFEEPVSQMEGDNYYSPYIVKWLSSGTKWVYYDPNWNQICTHAPSTGATIERVKICRCEGEVFVHDLTVSSSPVTGISISSATGHSGTTNYTRNIEESTSVSLTAPATHNNHQFTSWSGCDSVSGTGNRTCDLTINSNSTITANYKLITHTLSVSKSGTGTGTVTSSPSGIDCGPDCSASFDENTSVTLTPTASADSVFAGWSGDCAGNTCTLTMDSDKSVTATFDAINIIDCAKEYGQEYWCSSYEGWEKECQGRGDVKDLPQETFCKDSLGDIYDKCVTCWVPTYTLSVNSSPVTGISITGNPSTYSGTTNYTRTIEEGTSVSLTAPESYIVPGSTITYDFTNWSGTGCSTTNNTVSFSITSDMSCTANYKESITTHTLAISSTANGSVIEPGQGTFSYNKGETVDLLALADLGYKFTNWTGDTDTISNAEHSQTTITMEGDYSITANFKQAPECTTYNGNTYCRGFKSTDSQGSSCSAACSERGYTCPVGDNMFRSLSGAVQVAVELGLLGPGESYRSGASTSYYSPYIRTYFPTGDRYIFYDSGWNQNCTHTPSSSSTYQRVKICFCQEEVTTHTLSVTKAGTGSGTVTSDPAAINCGTTCSASFDQDASVTLTASSDDNSTFAGWSGACTGNTCTVTMDSDKSVTATFDAINIIDCAKEYGQEYWCSSYEGWEKECQGRGDVKDLPQETFCKDSLGDIYDKCVTCWVPTYTLTVNSSPVTGISITGNPSVYGGTTNYTRNIEEGTSVFLTAPSSHTTPTAVYDFVSWSGTGCSTTNRTVNVSMTGNRTCTANYRERAVPTYILSVSKTGTGSGTVTSSPSGINCGTTCSATFDENTSVTLTPTASSDSTFAGWSGACTGNTCTLTMDSDKSVTATFDKEVTYNLSVSSSPVTGISITSDTGHSGTTNYTRTNIAQGTSVSLTAPAKHNNYTFSNWTGCDSVSSTTCNLTLNNNRTVRANYEETKVLDCITFNNHIYCSGFSSEDPQGSSCSAACSARGYTCPTGDNMLRRTIDIAEVAVRLDLMSAGESYRLRSNRRFYSPYVETHLVSGAKAIYYDPGWNQTCTHAPDSGPNHEQIKICRCEEPSLAQIEWQLASLSEAASGLIEQLRFLIGR